MVTCVITDCLKDVFKLECRGYVKLLGIQCYFSEFPSEMIEQKTMLSQYINLKHIYFEKKSILNSCKGL